VESILPDVLRAQPAQNLCIVDTERSLTYGELEKQSRLFSVRLAKEGIEKKERVGLYLANGWRYVVAFYGILRLGAIPVPIDMRLTSREAGFIISNSGCRALVFTGDAPAFLDRVNPVRFNVPALEEDTPPDARLSQEDTAVIFYTGGTTGRPKGVPLTHRNILAVLGGLRSAWGLRWGEEVFLQVLPMTHSGGMNCSLNSALYAHSTCYILPKFDATQVLDTIEKKHVTVLVGVPTIYTQLVHSIKEKSWDLSSLRVCFSSGAPMSASVAREFHELTGKVVTVGWGLTEASPQLTVCPPGVFRKDYVGPPLPGTEIAAFRNGERLSDGEVGELGARGPQVMHGYWENPEETNRVFTREGFLLTGDTGCVTAEGVYILGRLKNMINSGGYKVWPNEVEQVIMENPHVKEVAVVGTSDERLGEAVKAFVVTDGNVTADELKAFCRERLAGYKVPRIFEFRKELPKSSVGKILHRMLLEEEKVNHESGGNFTNLG